MNVCQSNLLLVGIHLHLYTIDGLHNSTATAPAKTADETPVALLAPGKGKTHRAYMWVYRSTDYVAQRAVWFDFCSGRGGAPGGRRCTARSGGGSGSGKALASRSRALDPE